MFLKQVARVHSCVVLVTNHTVGSRSSWGRDGGSDAGRGTGASFCAHGLEEAGYVVRRAALGESWPGQVHVRLQLAMKEDPGGIPGLGVIVAGDSGGGGDSSGGNAADVDSRGVPRIIPRAAVLVQTSLGVPPAGVWTEFSV